MWDVMLITNQFLPIQPSFNEYVVFWCFLTDKEVYVCCIPIYEHCHWNYYKLQCAAFKLSLCIKLTKMQSKTSEFLWIRKLFGSSSQSVTPSWHVNFNSSFAVVSYFLEFEIKDQAQSMLSRSPIKISNCFPFTFTFTNNVYHLHRLLWSMYHLSNVDILSQLKLLKNRSSNCF